jgi:hypothetical protein
MENKKMKKKKMYRQGDILFIEVAQINTDAKKIDSNIIVEGESTGHSHRAVGNEVQLYIHDGKKYIETGKDVQIVHEEHKTIPLQKSKYMIVRQREYSGYDNVFDRGFGLGKRGFRYVFD